MSLTARRPKHATTPTVADPEQRALRAEAEAARLRQVLRQCDADRQQWRQRALGAEHTLSVLPSALANPDNLIRSLVGERDLAQQAAHELRTQLAQLQTADAMGGLQ